MREANNVSAHGSRRTVVRFRWYNGLRSRNDGSVPHLLWFLALSEEIIHLWVIAETIRVITPTATDRSGQGERFSVRWVQRGAAPAFVEDCALLQPPSLSSIPMNIFGTSATGLQDPQILRCY